MIPMTNSVSRTLLFLREIASLWTSVTGTALRAWILV